MSLDNTSALGIVSNTPRARAVRHLRDWITDGRLAAGDRLPPETKLASKLNVSRTTMRLALADIEKAGLISSDKRCRTVMGHVRAKRTFLSDAVALIMDSPEQFNRNKIHGTWHSNFIHTGAVDAVRSAGYDVLTIHPDHIVGDMIQRLISERPRGVIIMRSVLQDQSGEHIAKAFKEGNIPFALYGDIGLFHGNRQIASEIDTVVSDHEAGSYALTKWLIEKGSKRILRFWQFPYEGPEERQHWVDRRDAGYERAVKEAGLECLPPVEVYEGHYRPSPQTKEQFEVHSRLMAGYLVEYLRGSKPIDAIMGVSDSVVSKLIAAVRLHGKEPNRDVLIVGYDNMWDDTPDRRWENLGPAATVDKKNLEIGHQLMAVLKRRIDGELFEAGERRVVVPELVIRPSAIPGKREKLPFVVPIEATAS